MALLFGVHRWVRLDRELAACGGTDGVESPAGIRGVGNLDLELDHPALAVNHLGVPEPAEQIEHC